MTAALLTLPLTAQSGMFARRRDPILTVLVIVCGLIIVLAVMGPYIAPYSPTQTDILAANQPPSPAHPLGTDSLGRDILSRLLAGARLSIAGPSIIVVLSVSFGTTIALASAWWGGGADRFVSRALNVLFSIPGILIAMLAVAVFGTGFWAPVLALSLVYIPYVARVIRSAAIQERSRSYVKSLALAGVSSWRINTRHILRNIAPIVLAQATFGFASALMDFGAISFLGLGVQPPTPEWGLMVSGGRAELLQGNFSQSLSAGLMIVISVVAFNMLGERISERLGTR